MTIMIILSAIFVICMFAAFITGYLIDTKQNPEPPIVITFFLSLIIGFSAITSFILGHFTGL